MTTGTLNQQQLQDAQRQAIIARTRKIARRIIAYALMSFLGFVFLFPIIFMIVAAFKPNQDVIADLASWRAFFPDPGSLTTANIQDVFDRVRFEHLMFNSLFITLVTVISGLFVNSMAAFVLARLRWPGRKMVLGIIVSLIIIPLEAIAVPLMMQVNEMSDPLNYMISAIMILITALLLLSLWNAFGKFADELPLLEETPKPVRMILQAALAIILALPLEILTYFIIQQTRDGGSWLNSYHVQILPFVAEPFSIFLFYQFFIGIPKDFDEAAVVDGAGFFRIYWQVIVPLSRPVFATVAILKFLQFWSFYMWPLMVTRGDEYQPLMVGMDFFQTQAPIKWGSIMGYAAMVTIPVLITFLLFQKWFVQSVSSSGVKG
jgi:multiple sugar transport system permease protein